MALLRSGIAIPRVACRALSSHRIGILIDGDHSRVTCVCVVNNIPAGFQIDCGSTFSQISPELAPQHVPRHGLGSASCLGRRMWFPTCEVELAPVDPEGRVVQLGGPDEPGITRVQVGSSNLLGLHELRRWRVELSFAPEANHCSMLPSRTELPSLAAPTSIGIEDTISLADALQAASALNEGVVELEEARCSEFPWLVDASKVVAALRRRKEAPCWWPGFGFPCDALIAAPSSGAVPKASALGLSPALPTTAHVLFGTADALLSDSEIPPLLPPPPLLS